MTESQFDFDDEAAHFYSSLEVGITIYDAETGDIRYANAYAEELYGYQKEQLNRVNVGDLSPDSISESDFRKRIRAAADGQPQEFEWRIKRPSGEIIWLEMRLSQLSVDNQSHVIAVIRDISDYKMEVRHLHLLNRIISHNFRNELQVVQSSFNHIHGEKNNKILNRMRRAIAELVDLTSWVNALTSLNRDKQPKKVNVCELLTNRIEKYRTEYPDINWEINCENVYIEANQPLQKAFDELIENAIRHNSHEDLDITVSASENIADQQIDIQIMDTGQPIPDMEIQPLLGGYDPDPLEHAKNIGLWEVQTIINSHQGKLTLKENNPERKIIEITLPLADPK
ncbi:PAS domain-containing sensor histidine kinase [Halonotius terrestris]|uniref:histidine kinase n=1 Tax=Halonotius terrestris TaxID=2487750 RepID=A0A8J8P7A8_9EURY|nr:PAS domain-containing sensor histidine kinase [Halonotius terrestris]TQQ80920.1 PAS domain-containing sensor histidine kinase [Halonotius terrestris]